jgi:hypothetical protein
MALWYKKDRKSPEILIPLKEVKVRASFGAGIIKIDSELTYVNSDSNQDVNVSFEFPQQRGQVMANLRA